MGEELPEKEQTVIVSRFGLDGDEARRSKLADHGTDSRARSTDRNGGVSSASQHHRQKSHDTGRLALNPLITITYQALIREVPDFPSPVFSL